MVCIAVLKRFVRADARAFIRRSSWSNEIDDLLWPFVENHRQSGLCGTTKALSWPCRYWKIEKIEKGRKGYVPFFKDCNFEAYFRVYQSNELA